MMNTPLQAYKQAYDRAVALALPAEKAHELGVQARERATSLLAALARSERSGLVADSMQQTMDRLRDAGRARWPDRSVWPRDFGDSYVVFEVWDEGAGEQLYRLSYGTKADGSVTLGDEETPVEEHRSTTFVETAGHVVESTRERAFVIEHDGRVLLTARAGATEMAGAIGGNPGFTYISGRFVGAEKANRNNAYWSTDDLAFGQPSVNYGPLNWLHDDKQIIGAIADSKLVMPSPVEQANELAEPYIGAAAVMWKYLYPQQSAVVEQANADGQLWFSMECVSGKVNCIDHQCGEWSYADYMQKAACEHLTERSARVHFKDPIFLGGALIVPPVRPGWAEAEARIVERAAEQAYGQARPQDVSDEMWMKVVSGVLAFAGDATQV